MTSFTGIQNKILHKLVTHKITQKIGNILCKGRLKSHWRFCFVTIWNNIFYQNKKTSWWAFRLYHCWWSILVDWLRLHNGWKLTTKRAETVSRHEDLKSVVQGSDMTPCDFCSGVMGLWGSKPKKQLHWT